MSFGDVQLDPELPTAEVGNDVRPFAAELGAGMAPGAGLADASGVFPNFQDPDEQYYDGLLTNIEKGNYGTAAMQGLAMFGDALWAGGPVAGAIGSTAKMPLALSRALARRSSAFQHMFKGSKIIDEVDNGPKLVFHGTLRDFKKFDPELGELGSHFGPIEQADMFVRPGAEWLQRSGQNMRAGYLRINNPLRLEDRMTFDVTAASTRAQLRKILGDKLPERGIRGQASIADNRGMQNSLKEAGYDGVVYLNRNEGVPDRQARRPADMTESEWENHLNGISDEKFKEYFPEAQDSYIIFDSDQFINAFGIAAE